MKPLAKRWGSLRARLQPPELVPAEPLSGFAWPSMWRALSLRPQGHGSSDRGVHHFHPACFLCTGSASRLSAPIYTSACAGRAVATPPTLRSSCRTGSGMVGRRTFNIDFVQCQGPFTESAWLVCISLSPPFVVARPCSEHLFNHMATGGSPEPTIIYTLSKREADELGHSLGVGSIV